MKSLREKLNESYKNSNDFKNKVGKIRQKDTFEIIDGESVVLDVNKFINYLFKKVPIYYEFIEVNNDEEWLFEINSYSMDGSVSPKNLLELEKVLYDFDFVDFVNIDTNKYTLSINVDVLKHKAEIK